MERIQTKLDEKKEFFVEDLFNEEISFPNSLEKANNQDLQAFSSNSKEEFLDKIFTIAKWVLLYLPGVATIHLSMMGLALMFFYGEYEPILGLLGLIAFGTFLIMLGFGKMKDLKYLKTVLTILGFSFLLAIFWDVLAILIKGDFLGLYSKVTFPLIALIGYLSKRAIDKETEKDEL